MLLDNEGLFSDNQKITTGTIYSDNIVRLGLGDVSFVPVIVQVTKDFTGLEKLNVKFQTSSDVAFSNPIDLIESELNLADLKEGKMFPINYLPKGNLGYMRICYTVAGTETTGTITASTVMGQDNR